MEDLKQKYKNNEVENNMMKLGLGKVLATTVLATAVGGFVGLNEADAAQGDIPKVLQEKINQGAIDWNYQYNGDDFTYNYNLGTGYVYGSGKYSLEDSLTSGVGVVSEGVTNNVGEYTQSLAPITVNQTVVNNVNINRVNTVEAPKPQRVNTVRQTQTRAYNNYVSPVKQTSIARTSVGSSYSNVGATALSVASGKSYVYGGNSSYGVDCSAFAQQVMSKLGKSIPRTTYAQMAAGTRVSTPQAGDLVFFNGGSHVGVYIGNGQMVDALNPTAGIGQRAVSYISGSVTGYYRY